MLFHWYSSTLFLISIHGDCITLWFHNVAQIITYNLIFISDLEKFQSHQLHNSSWVIMPGLSKQRENHYWLKLDKFFLKIVHNCNAIPGVLYSLVFFTIFSMITRFFNFYFSKPWLFLVLLKPGIIIICKFLTNKSHVFVTLETCRWAGTPHPRPPIYLNQNIYIKLLMSCKKS